MVVSEKREADYDGRTGELRALYVTPFLDENLLKEDYTGPGPLLAWYTQDGLGSVRQLVVGDTVQNSYAYTSWGVPLNWQEHISNRYTFTGREWNAENALYHYRTRHYNPFTSAFTSPDPLFSRDPQRQCNLRIYRSFNNKNLAPSMGRQWHRYLYVENRSTLEKDPTGMGFWTCTDECEVEGDVEVAKVEARLLAFGTDPDILGAASFASDVVDLIGLVGALIGKQRQITLPKVVDLYIMVLNEARGRFSGWHLYTKVHWKKCECCRCILIVVNYLDWCSYSSSWKKCALSGNPVEPDVFYSKRQARKKVKECTKAHLKSLGFIRE